MTPKEVRKLWVENLRGNTYKQGKYRLVDTNGTFCPLGVLCDLAVKAGVTERVGRSFGKGGAEYRRIGGLPQEVQDWAGLCYDSGVFYEPSRGCTSIISLNDSGGYTFSQIADVIESEPEGLVCE